MFFRLLLDKVRALTQATHEYRCSGRRKHVADSCSRLESFCFLFDQDTNRLVVQASVLFSYFFLYALFLLFAVFWTCSPPPRRSV